MKGRTIVMVCALVLSTTLLFAQGGSNYSALGIGDLRYGVGAVYDGMGGTQISMPSPYAINVVNPSLLGIAATTRIQAGYKFNQNLISSSDATSLQNNGKLDGLLAMFSVDTAYGFAISFGILPYSSLNYSTTRNVNTVLNGEILSGQSSQLGKGGVSQLHLGSSVRITDNLQIGISGAALFGVFEYSDKVSISGNYWNVINRKTYDIRGLLFRGGLWWQPVKGLNVGAFVSGGTEASVYITREAKGINPVGVYYDTVQIEYATTGLPVMGGIGMSVLTGKNLIGLDFMVGDFSALRVNERPDVKYSTLYRTSVGFQHPGDRSSIASFFDKIGYYAGAYVEKLYVRYAGKDLNEYAGSIGISFPLGGNSMVDAAVQGGWRGLQIEKYLTEIFAKLTVTVSIGETWFKPFARD